MDTSIKDPRTFHILRVLETVFGSRKGKIVHKGKDSKLFVCGIKGELFEDTGVDLPSVFIETEQNCTIEYDLDPDHNPHVSMIRDDGESIVVPLNDDAYISLSSHTTCASYTFNLHISSDTSYTLIILEV